MNWLDILILCLAGIGFMKGLFDGVIKQVVSLIALVVAVFFCGKGAVWLRDYIAALDWIPAEWVTVASYVAAFLLIMIVVMLAGEIVHRVIGVTPLSPFNHVAGGLFGLVLAVLFMSLLLNRLELADRTVAVIPAETKIESRFYFPVKEILPTIYPHSLFLMKD
ncbi:MAG: CvpA family protein [Tannerellaceae bacterium]|nr:CvpA family protein [Tannerellaceae bacterium]